MKYKKISYIIVFVLMLITGINKTYAVEEKHCYYISSDNQSRIQLKMRWGYPNGFAKTLTDYAAVNVDQSEGTFLSNKETVVNWWADGINNLNYLCIRYTNICFPAKYNTEKEANNASNPQCPQYLVFEDQGSVFNGYKVYATDSKILAQEAEAALQKNTKKSGFYASRTNSSGNDITAEEYYGAFGTKEFIKFENGELKCEQLLGDKNDPDSIHYMINEVMGYIRFIVPGLIIILGILDFAKAVLASKEDNMKKAQQDFIKRLFIGVAVFLVPVLINVIMELAEIVWQGEGYKICNL